MNENTIKTIIDIAEDLGWTVSHDKENNTWGFSIYTPEGMDGDMTIDGGSLEELKHSLYEYWTDYDVSQETYYWLDSSGHGTNGAPYDMKDVYEDIEWFSDKIKELGGKINEIEEE